MSSGKKRSFTGCFNDLDAVVRQLHSGLGLLTNHLKFAARTITDIYKDRWQIEIFFKALKQNLKVKTFVGTSENAFRVQIWTALITQHREVYWQPVLNQRRSMIVNTLFLYVQIC